MNQAHSQVTSYSQHPNRENPKKLSADITEEIKSQVPYIVWVHSKWSDIVSDIFFCDCNIVTNSNISSGCHNHCFIKPRDVDDDTEDNDRNMELEHTQQDLDIGILLSILVGLADSCESDERNNQTKA